MEKKTTLHPRNLHQGAYDFKHLCKQYPALQGFIRPNPNGIPSINFAHAKAVKTLNQALLQVHYGVKNWDIPPGYLCPPVPGRADYLHYLSDLLAIDNQKVIPKGKKIKVLDIGTGANLIYPILGHAIYGWQFVGTDIDKMALQAAQQNLTSNLRFSKAIALRLQNKPPHLLQHVLQKGEVFDLTMCNPPFHSSATEAQKGTARKWKNLGKETDLGLNFGGQANELWCKGGEIAFIQRLIEESKNFASTCYWFTCLVSKKENLPKLYKALTQAKVNQIKTVQMAQGQKNSRFVAWTFLQDAQRKAWRQYRW